MAVAKKKSPKKRNRKAVKKTAFAIMPFGGWFDGYYTSVFCPAIKTTGLAPRRADDLYRPSTIVADIWALTKSSAVVIADLTGKNPNVFYELGMAHALGKPAILVTESMDDVPFDLRQLRVLVYDKNEPRWGEILTSKLEQAIDEVLEDPDLSLPSFVLESNNAGSAKRDKRDNRFREMQQQINMLMSRLNTSRTRIGAVEAESMIDSLLQEGLPIELIMSRVIEAGAPRNWVESKLNEKIHHHYVPRHELVSKKADKRLTIKNRGKRRK